MNADFLYVFIRFITLHISFHEIEFYIWIAAILLRIRIEFPE
jgi:hypothetical protein